MRVISRKQNNTWLFKAGQRVPLTPVEKYYKETKSMVATRERVKHKPSTNNADWQIGRTRHPDPSYFSPLAGIVVTGRRPRT